MPRSSNQDSGSEDPFYRPRGEEKPPRRAPIALDDDGAGEDEGAFLRGKKRVPVRKAGIRKSVNKFLLGAAVVLVLAIVGLTALAVRQYETHSWRFVIESSDSIETGTLKHVARSQVLEVFGGDIGRNIFFVPLEARQKQLEAVPWIQSATVMRFLPNRLRVEVKERTPVAFVQIGRTTGLIDASGVVMSMPVSTYQIATGAQDKFSFPVITGLQSSEPLSVRAASMKIFARLERELDANDAAYMNDVSEVDLSDPQDVRLVVGDSDGTVLVHLGNSDFQRRYRFYLEHIKAWRQQYQVRSVDLRYDGQVIVNREGQATQK